MRMDASNAQGLKGHLPQNISPDAMERLDVVFFPSTSKCNPSLKGDNARIESNNQKLKSNKRASDLEKPANEYSEDMPEFAATISVMVLKEEFSSENLEKEQVGDAFKDALSEKKSDSKAIKSFSPIVTKTDDGVFSRASFQVGDTKVKSEQSIVVKSGRTFIVTCTYAADDKTVPELCKSTAKSLKVKR